jgi:hypothetical protein
VSGFDTLNRPNASLEVGGNVTDPVTGNGLEKLTGLVDTPVLTTTSAGCGRGL